jgi:hypothetical protein
MKIDIQKNLPGRFQEGSKKVPRRFRTTFFMGFKKYPRKIKN